MITSRDGRGSPPIETLVEKPDPRLFAIALERAGARPETTLHVGDFYWIDVQGARAAGLRAVQPDVAGLYGGTDCPRVRSLGELADVLAAGEAENRITTST